APGVERRNVVSRRDRRSSAPGAGCAPASPARIRGPPGGYGPSAAARPARGGGHSSRPRVPGPGEAVPPRPAGAPGWNQPCHPAPPRTARGRSPPAGDFDGAPRVRTIALALPPRLGGAPELRLAPERPGAGERSGCGPGALRWRNRGARASATGACGGAEDGRTLDPRRAGAPGGAARPASGAPREPQRRRPRRAQGADPGRAVGQPLWTEPRDFPSAVIPGARVLCQDCLEPILQAL